MEDKLAAEDRLAAEVADIQWAAVAGLDHHPERIDFWSKYMSSASNLNRLRLLTINRRLLTISRRLLAICRRLPTIPLTLGSRTVVGETVGGAIWGVITHAIGSWISTHTI